jgi:diguanylate cyclase (GGDEF)-like protein
MLRGHRRQLWFAFRCGDVGLMRSESTRLFPVNGSGRVCLKNPSTAVDNQRMAVRHLLRVRGRDTAFVVVGVIVWLAYLAVPLSVGRPLYGVIALAAAAAAVVGLLRQRPQPFRAWLFVCAGTVVALAVETWFGLQSTRGATVAPLIDDFGFAIVYLLMLVGVLGIIRERSQGRDVASWLDALSIAAGGIAVSWTVFWDRVVAARGDLVGQSAPLVNAVAGFALVVVTLRACLANRTAGSGLWLLLGGVSLHAAADTVARIPDFWNSRLTGSTWLLGYVLIGAAQVRPRRGDVKMRAAAPAVSAETRRILLVQAVATFLLLLAAPMQLVEGNVVGIVVWLTLGLTVLAFNRVRLMRLLSHVLAASGSDSQRRMAALLEHSHEVVGLVSADGNIEYISPAIEPASGRPVSAWLGRSVSELSSSFDGMLPAIGAALGTTPGDTAVWQGPLNSPLGTIDVEVTVSNHLQTPEVGGYIFTVRDRTGQVTLENELRHRANHDFLTELANRTQLAESLDASLREQVPVAVMLIDLDDFKSVNDTRGHDAGDELLVAVAHRLRHVMGAGGLIARLGGDEFAVVLQGSRAADANALAHDMLASVTQPFHLGVDRVTLSASIGIAQVGDTEATVSDLLRSADIAMYEAKRAGKARVVVFSDAMQAEIIEEATIREELVGATERGEVSLVYQPIVDLDTARLLGFEALVRWTHPKLGSVSPARFVPIAERSGAIVQLGAWVLGMACREAASWPDHLYVSVNVASNQLTEERLLDDVDSALTAATLHPARLMLELTESSLIHRLDQVDRNLGALRERGVKLAIDDFGTGYSSLSYLKRFDVDVVKIDRSFVSGIAGSADHAALTKTIVALADILSITAIAEGVETEAEREELLRLGCSYAQGYLFARPMPPSEIPVLLQAHLVDDTTPSA